MRPTEDPTDGNQHARRACVGCAAGRARSQGARTPARGKDREPAAMKSEESGERVAARPNRKRRNRERAALRRALAHTAEGGRMERQERDGDCLPEGEKAGKQGGKGRQPPATEERPKDTPIHFFAGTKDGAPRRGAGHASWQSEGNDERIETERRALRNGWDAGRRGAREGERCSACKPSATRP